MTGCQGPVGAVENGSLVFQAAVGAFFSVRSGGRFHRQPCVHAAKVTDDLGIDANVRSNLLHDRLLSVRLWRRKALTRDIGGHRPPCRVRQHYDVTIAGRSFHIV